MLSWLAGVGGLSAALAGEPPPGPSLSTGLDRLPAPARWSAGLPPPGDAAEPSWITGFRQVAPTPGAPPSRHTALQIGHDGQRLIVRIQAAELSPGQLVARQLRRDQESMLGEDVVVLVIDPEGRGRDGFLFAVNAHGAQFDALVYDGGQTRHDWDATWESEAHRDAQGWTAVLRIPLSVFGRRATRAAGPTKVT